MEKAEILSLIRFFDKEEKRIELVCELLLMISGMFFLEIGFGIKISVREACDITSNFFYIVSGHATLSRTSKLSPNSYLYFYTTMNIHLNFEPGKVLSSLLSAIVLSLKSLCSIYLILLVSF